MTIAVALWTPRRWYEVSTTASRTVTGGLQDLGKLRIAGVVSISLVGVIHLLVTPEYCGSPPTWGCR